MSGEKILIVYVDLDGVLANFEKKFHEMYGIEIEKLSVSELDLIKKRMAEDQFFSKIEPYENAKEFINYLMCIFPRVEILTSVGKFNSVEVANQKEEWVKKHISDSIKFNYVTSSSKKASYASGDAILIDDRDKALLPWIESGGQAVKHFSIENTLKII